MRSRRPQDRPNAPRQTALVVKVRGPLVGIPSLRIFYLPNRSRRRSSKVLASPSATSAVLQRSAPASCIEMNTRARHGYVDARSRQFIIIASYVLVVAATAIARLPGLNPASLRWDDLWVGTLAKASLREALTIPNSTPPGFLLILWLFRRLIPDPEWSLQLLPFLCGLAVIPLTGAVVSRITESSLLGLAAAATVAVNPMLATYSVFVKQFTLDACATAVLLLAALPALHRPSPTALWTVAALGLLMFFFSLDSILASFLLVHLVCLFALIDARSSLGALCARLLPVILFDLVLLVWFQLDVRHRSNPLLSFGEDTSCRRRRPPERFIF